jgi:hypothetical protein
MPEASVPTANIGKKPYAQTNERANITIFPGFWAPKGYRRASQDEFSREYNENETFRREALIKMWYLVWVPCVPLQEGEKISQRGLLRGMTDRLQGVLRRDN